MRSIVLIFVVFMTVPWPMNAWQRAGRSRLSSLPAAAQSTISSVLGREISSYHAKAVGARFEAASSQQRLVTDFSSQGVEVRSGSAWWGLSLRGYGYGDAIKKVSMAVPHAELNRVEYRRGPLTEWYVNGPAGIEQGFSIAKPPARANGKPLTIALTLSAQSTVAVDQNRTGMTLTGRHGDVKFRYAGLTAKDDPGKELRAWLQIRGEELLLRIDDAGARYPIVVDPFIQLAELIATDGQVSYQPKLGTSVAISGNTVAAGAPGAQIGGTVAQGAVYVFVKPRNGWRNMKQVAKLTASDGGYVDGLGESVAISGTTIVAGSHTTIGQHANQGAAYVFVRPPNGWADMTQTAKLTSSDGKGDDLFGASVSIDSNTIAVGAPYATQLAGKAYVFTMPIGGWVDMTQTAELTPSDPIPDSIFGTAVQIDGETVAVGEPYKNVAYVFVMPPGGWANMHETAKLSPTDNVDFDLFGFSLDISGDTVVIGKPSATNSGSAYVYLKPPGGWTNMTQTAKLTASDGTAGDYFGSSIFTNDKEIVVGAMNAVIGANWQQGAAYVFMKPPSGWKDTSTFKAKLTATNGAAEYFFGFSVAGSGTTVVVGAPYTNIGLDTTNPGAAYVFGR